MSQLEGNITRKTLVELQKNILALSNQGSEFTPIIMISKGTSFTMHTTSVNGVSLNRMGSRELSLLIGEGSWILLGQDVWVVLNSLSKLVQNNLSLIERPKRGKLIFTDLLKSEMIVLDLTVNSKLKLYFTSIFSPVIRRLLSNLNKLQ